MREVDQASFAAALRVDLAAAGFPVAGGTLAWVRNGNPIAQGMHAFAA